MNKPPLKRSTVRYDQPITLLLLLGYYDTLRAAVVLDTSVADPDPNPDPDLSDPYVFGPPGSGSGSFFHQAKILRKTLNPTAL
jgi:hypothetical protein